MEKINILIAEDHTLTATLLEFMLKDSEDIHVAGIATNGNEVVSMASNLEVDIILMDIKMPGLDGLNSLSRIVKSNPKIKIIMLSSHSEAWIIQKALKWGALGYVTKYAEKEEVMDAIVTVHKGGHYLCKTSVNSITQNFTSKPTGSESLFNSLTKREKEVLQLIAEELTSPEIADKLCISVSTVEIHRRHLLQKLGAKNMVGLIKTAIEANLIEEKDEEMV
jgi:DNA-binding NarL/FixJ family response regulator